MDENEKIEERKRENGRFLSAFKYMMKANGLTQDELAKRMGKSSSLISDYKSGKKKVSEDTMRELALISGSKLNLNYMLGYSDYILLENVPQEEFMEISARRNNPDYERMKEKRDEVAEPTPAPFIPSWADSLISIMTEQIKQNEALNRELRQSIAEVNSLKSDLAAILHLLKN